MAAPAAARERPAADGAADGAAAPLRERELTALWLLGRVPRGLLPRPLLRAGRAGRGPGPDVREAAFLGPDGAIAAGDVEAHLAASGFARHGHLADPAYAGVALHLVWTDDRRTPGAPQPLPGGGDAPTVAVGPALGHSPERLRRLLRLGPRGAEPCAAAARGRGAAATSELVRAQGRRRLAERARRAAALAAARGWDGAWEALLLAALEASAGRSREGAAERAQAAARIGAALGPEPLRALRGLALGSGGRPRALIGALRADGALGAGRAGEAGWNAALPLLAAAATAFGDAPLARAAALLAARWPAPRPYGRTRALAGLLGPPPRGAGAQHAQGLLHLQDLWCERGGCGVCPLSAPPPAMP